MIFESAVQICIEEQRRRDKRSWPELLYFKNVRFHFHNNRSRVFHNIYRFWYLNNNHLSRLLIVWAHTPIFLTTVLGDSDLVRPQMHTEIFSSSPYGFSTFPMNFKKLARMKNFIFITDTWHILTCLHTKVALLTVATFFKYAMNHCIPFPFFHAPLPLSYLQQFC